MVRKIISILLCLIFLLGMGIPAFATTKDDTSIEKKTIDDILNEYHAKTFHEMCVSEQNTPFGYSTGRTSAGKTLEEETVEELNNAGYEAYNVTPVNYKALEKTLNADFSELGLLPDGTYIVVLSGDIANSTSTRDYGIPGTSFEYTYNGITHTMRHVTVMPAHNPGYYQVDAVTLISASTTSAQVESILNGALYSILDVVSDGLGTFASLCGISFININLSYNKALSIQTEVSWIRTYTQIYKEDYGSWASYSSVDYALVKTKLTGSFYDNSTNSIKQINKTIEDRYESANYSVEDWKEDMAARGWYYGTAYHDYVGDITIGYYKNANSTNFTEIFYFAQYEGTAP